MDERKDELFRQREERVKHQHQLFTLQRGVKTLEFFALLDVLRGSSDEYGKRMVGNDILPALPNVVTHLDVEGVVVTRDPRQILQIPEGDRVMWDMDNVRSHMSWLQQHVDRERLSRPYPQRPPRLR